MKKAKLYIISGQASYYQEEGDLMAYISKHGQREIFGPVVDKCLVSGYRGAYTFAFLAKKPTEKQMEYLDNCTITVNYEADRVDEI